jgi:hypothetical protein
MEMGAVVAPYKVYKDMQKKAEQLTSPLFLHWVFLLRVALCFNDSPQQLSARNANIVPVNTATNIACY